MPVLTVVAGPNGAGKSTIIKALSIEGIHNLIDTDAIAKRMNPFDPLQAAVSAGREAIKRTRHYLQNRESFVWETTLSGNSAIEVMRVAKTHGFTVNLLYVYLDALELSMKRVRERASQGGHFVPDEDIRRRYSRSLFHLSKALPLTDHAIVYDNSGVNPRRILETRQSAMVWCEPDAPLQLKQIIAELKS